MTQEPFKPISYTDRLGRRRVIVEVPNPPLPSRKVARLHSHTHQLGGVLYRSKHMHEVNPDASEHIHPTPENPNAA